jgi:predicted dehydrogenase
VTHPEVEIVIVATTYDQLAAVAKAAAEAGKHVLIEKPGARRAAELEPVLRESERTGVQVRVGFNHCYHRALQESRKILELRRDPIPGIRDTQAAWRVIGAVYAEASR